MVEQICVHCGKQFNLCISHIKRGGGKFCSRECRDLHYKGQSSPYWIGRVMVICNQCGKTFKKYPNLVKNNNFCSKFCQTAHQKENPMPEAIRKKISIANKGKKKPDGFSERLRKINTGKHPSKETLKKQSECRMGEKNHNFGKPMSIDQRRKISESNKGKTATLITRKRLSDSHKGNKSMVGRHHSLTTRKKMSDSHKGKMCGEKHPQFGKPLT